MAFSVPQQANTHEQAVYECKDGKKLLLDSGAFFCVSVYTLTKIHLLLQDEGGRAGSVSCIQKGLLGMVGL